MEKTTSLTFLFHSSTAEGEFKKLIDITSYPDLFSPPEKLDVSDLSSNQKKYAPGMVDVPDMEFGYNYTKASYDSVKGKEDAEGFYQIRFGENGEFGAWQFPGKHFATPTGGAVGETRKGKLIIYPAGEIKPVTVNAAKTDSQEE